MAGDTSKLLGKLAALAPVERASFVEAQVLEVVRLVGDANADISASTPLMDAGIDSLAATELSSRVESLTELPLSPTIMFEYPTARAIAAHIVGQVASTRCRRRNFYSNRLGSCRRFCRKRSSTIDGHRHRLLLQDHADFRGFRLLLLGRFLLRSTQSPSVGD